VIVLVTGSRTWDQPLVVAEAMIEARDNPPAIYVPPPSGQPAEKMRLRHGASGKADMTADMYATKWGWEIQRYPAAWNLYGPAAGNIRNTFMVNDGIHLCLSFHDVCISRNHLDKPAHWSHGAMHCADFAEDAGYEVRRAYACAQGDLEQRRDWFLLRSPQTPSVAS